MSLKLHPLAPRGDTIVEVMLVLAVLGLALTISYSTATRSLQNTRQAQETAEATALAQSQIEALRSLATPSATSNIYQPGSPFCVNTGVTPFVKVAPPGPACSANPLFTVSIVYSQLSTIPIGGKFTVTITWPDVSGQGNDTVTQVYRQYQQQ